MKTAFQRDGWAAALGLVLLSLIPAIAGTLRLADLAGGAITPDTARFFADPMPIVLHIVGSLSFALFGAFQFVPLLRRRWPQVHRIGGRALVIAGFVSALTGVYMTLSYELPAVDSTVLDAIRIVVGIAMTGALVIGIAAARVRDFATHRAYMIRAYALAMGAGTQVLTHLPYALLIGTPDETARTVLMGAGWAINVVVAELVIHRIRLRTRMPAFSAGQTA